MAKVVFIFNGKEIAIQCEKEDKMKDICNKFSIKIDININSLLFIYGGSKINYELTFKQQANSMDNNINEIKILVYQKEKDMLKCQKCGETIHLYILDNILKYNEEQKDIFIEMKSQIDNIIKLNNIRDMIRKIKLIKILLDNLISENEKSSKDIQNTLNNCDNIKTKNDDYNLKLINENNLELIAECNLESYEKKYLEYYIEKSLKLHSDYMDIAKCINNFCSKKKEGKWSVIVGERDKYKFLSYLEQMMIVNIGQYKIAIFYNN